MPKVKVCGITNLKDALAAEKAGADIIGFIFAKSPRRIKPAAIKRIARALKMSTMKAGVFVNEDADKVNALVKELKLNFVQLSGDETPAYARKIKGAKIIKAIHVRNGTALRKQVRQFGNRVYAFLLDTYDKKKRGGTGRAFNWNLVKGVKVPFFVAGGLNPGNVKDAIKKARPFGVDVSSGIEARPGRKDMKKMKDFFKAVKG
jgi:phosphoribosylanthranilate isomerase